MYFGPGAVEFRFGIVSGESELGGPEDLYALGEGGVVGSVERKEEGVNGLRKVLVEWEDDLWLDI